MKMSGISASADLPTLQVFTVVLRHKLYLCPFFYFDFSFEIISSCEKCSFATFTVLCSQNESQTAVGSKSCNFDSQNICSAS